MLIKIRSSDITSLITSYERKMVGEGGKTGEREREKKKHCRKFTFEKVFFLPSALSWHKSLDFMSVKRFYSHLRGFSGILCREKCLFGFSRVFSLRYSGIAGLDCNMYTLPTCKLD